MYGKGNGRGYKKGIKMATAPPVKSRLPDSFCPSITAVSSG